MKRTKKLTALSIVVLFSLLSSIILPTSVLADDSTPPPVETSVAPPPTDEPVVNDVSTEPPAAAEASTQEPVTDVTISPEEILPTDPIATEIAAIEAPAAVEPDTQKTDTASLTEVVAQLNSSDLVLTDENGQSIPWLPPRRSRHLQLLIRLAVLQVFCRFPGAEPA